MIPYGYRSSFRVFLLTVCGVRHPRPGMPRTRRPASGHGAVSLLTPGGRGSGSLRAAGWRPGVRLRRPAGPARKTPPMPPSPVAAPVADNRLLAALPRKELQKLQAELEVV